jgi:hypothetical protein
VEAAGQLFHLFRDGLDYAFILPHPNPLPEPVEGVSEEERGVLFDSGFPETPHPNPLPQGARGSERKVVIES